MAFLFAKAARLVTCSDRLKMSWDVSSLGFIGFYTSFFFSNHLVSSNFVFKSVLDNPKSVSLGISFIFTSYTLHRG